MTAFKIQFKARIVENSCHIPDTLKNHHIVLERDMAGITISTTTDPDIRKCQLEQLTSTRLRGWVEFDNLGHWSVKPDKSGFMATCTLEGVGHWRHGAVSFAH